jgi:hypothetical protein
MRIILVAFVMLGFASGNVGWCFGQGLLNQPISKARNSQASSVRKSPASGHTKFGIRPRPPAANPISASLLPSANKFISASLPSISTLTFQRSSRIDEIHSASHAIAPFRMNVFALLHSSRWQSDPSQMTLTWNHYLRHLADSLRAEIGVACRDLETGKEFFFNERRMMHAASTMKVPVMIEVFRQAEKGKFRLDDSLLVKNTFKSIVDGSPFGLDIGDDSDESMYRAIGKRMPIRLLVEQMITVSSNLATNLLIEFEKKSTIARKPYILVVLTRGIQEEKSAHRVIAEISRKIYDGLMTSL